MILSYTALENYYRDVYTLNCQLLYNKSYENYNLYSNSINIRYKQSVLVGISILYGHISKSSSNFLHLNANYNFIARNFWNKFINQYWQETIFISNSEPLSETYIHQLKTNGLSIYKGNDYKKFLLEFSKALMNGSIQVSMNSHNQNCKSISIPKIINNKNTYIKYIWRKGIYWYISLINVKYLYIKKHVFNKISLLNFNNIELNSLPIFAIVNAHNQFIMSESPEQIMLQKNPFYMISKLFHELVKQNTSLKVNYTGLLFVNPEDACEYKEYIEDKYQSSSHLSKLRCFTGHLNLYKDLISNSWYNTEFRLIPDLKEVSDLVQHYQYYSNVILNNKQNYGKNYFQGQPIYSIKSISAKNKNTNKTELVNYFYYIKKGNDLTQCKAIFLNYNTALIAWNKFKREYNYYNLPIKPYLQVSSLETFFKDYSHNNNNVNYIFIPSQQTYKIIKQQKKEVNNSSFKHIVNNKSVYIKNLIERMVWSLTSRQPINW